MPSVTRLKSFIQHSLLPAKNGRIDTSNPMESVLDKSIDAAVKKYMQKPNTVGLSIGIITGDGISTYGYGKTKKINGSIPNARSIFGIGSITKTFTAAILANFAAAGKLKLNDPITMYLPADLTANIHLREITLLHLANHTSGLPRLPANFFLHCSPFRNPYKNYSNAMLFAALKRVQLNNPPGEAYAYSNLGFGLLGVILERVSGQSYTQLVRQLIADPLKMESTAQHRKHLPNDLTVTGYNSWGIAAVNWDFKALAGCGALHSTVNDLLLYAKANMAAGNDSVTQSLKSTHQITLTKPKVGLGWHVFTLNGTAYHWHNGGTYGSKSFLLFNAEKNIAIVLLSNAAVSCDELAIDILKTIHPDN